MTTEQLKEGKEIQYKIEKINALKDKAILSSSATELSYNMNEPIQIYFIGGSHFSYRPDIITDSMMHEIFRESMDEIIRRCDSRICALETEFEDL